MKGKQKCNILREIRQKIAAENDIPYQTKDCTHTGECSGTCPYCEAEVRYLEDQLKNRAQLGKQIRIAAVCAGMTAVVAGCSVVDSIVSQVNPSPTPTEEWVQLSGEVPWPAESTEKTSETENIKIEPTITVPVPSSGTTTVEIGIDELSGYVPYEH